MASHQVQITRNVLEFHGRRDCLSRLQAIVRMSGQYKMKPENEANPLSHEVSRQSIVNRMHWHPEENHSVRAHSRHAKSPLRNFLISFGDTFLCNLFRLLAETMPRKCCATNMYADSDSRSHTMTNMNIDN